jgi:hypothetical protein
MRGKADVPVSDVPVAAIVSPPAAPVQARGARLARPSLRAVRSLPRRMGKPCAGSDPPDNVEALHPNHRETAIPITTMASASGIQF